jgi:hypothetical protein
MGVSICSARLVDDGSAVNMMPPRDANDDDAEDEEEDIEPDDDTEPAVIREPDE